MKRSRIIMLVFLVSLFIPINFVGGAALPEIDGEIDHKEWNEGHQTIIRMENGIDITLTTIYTEFDAYFLAEVPHNSPGDVIIRDPNMGEHDYFGIEFDNNNDGAIMGTRGSPDDMVLIDYDVPGAIDMYSHSFKVFKDHENNGKDNVIGFSGERDGVILYEFKKSLTSYDLLGYDVRLQKGDSYYIMPAVWDDKHPGSAIAAVNIQIGDSLFIKLTVGDIVFPLFEEIISSLTIMASLGILLLLYRHKLNK